MKYGGGFTASLNLEKSLNVLERFGSQNQLDPKELGEEPNYASDLVTRF